MRENSKWKKRLALLVFIGILAVSALLVAETFRILLPGLWTVFRQGDEKALSAYLQRTGTIRSFLILWFLSFVQVVAIVIPAMPVQLAAGVAYGPWKGFLSSFSASLLANMMVFLLARRMDGLVNTLAEGHPKIEKLLDSVRSSRDPWYYTILAFMTPGLPNGIIPYAAARAHMTPGAFLKAIFLALPVPTLLTCAAGGFILSGDWEVSVLIGAGLYACVGFLFFKRARVLALAHDWQEKRDARRAARRVP